MELWEYIYYQILPDVYHEKDELEADETLKRFLQAIDEAVLSELIEEIDGLHELVDIERCPEEVLPYWCNVLGFEYDERYPTDFLRRILIDIGHLYRLKGTEQVIIYLAEEMSGFTAHINEFYRDDNAGLYLNDVRARTNDETRHLSFITEARVVRVPRDMYGVVDLRLEIPSDHYLYQEMGEERLTSLMAELIQQFLPYHILLQIVLTFVYKEVAEIRRTTSYEHYDELTDRYEELYNISSSEVVNFSEFEIIDRENRVDNTEISKDVVEIEEYVEQKRVDKSFDYHSDHFLKELYSEDILISHNHLNTDEGLMLNRIEDRLNTNVVFHTYRFDTIDDKLMYEDRETKQTDIDIIKDELELVSDYSELRQSESEDKLPYSEIDERLEESKWMFEHYSVEDTITLNHTGELLNSMNIGAKYFAHSEIDEQEIEMIDREKNEENISDREEIEAGEVNNETRIEEGSDSGEDVISHWFMMNREETRLHDDGDYSIIPRTQEKVNY